MTLCDDLSDVASCGVLDLVPAWLELVSARVARPQVAVRTTGWALYAEHPSGLLLTVFCDGEGRWGARVSSRVTIAGLGRDGRAFSPLGDVPLGGSPRGCGDPGDLAALVNELLDPAIALGRVSGAANASLLTYWRARFPSATDGVLDRHDQSEDGAFAG